jgi:hypothetical protein
MNTCRACGGPTSKEVDLLCNFCRDLESKAEIFIHTRPRPREFFWDLIIMAGQTLRAEADRKEGGQKRNDQK